MAHSLNPTPALASRTPDLAATIGSAIREAQAAQPVILRAPSDPQADYQVLRNPTPAAALRFLDMTVAAPLAAPTAPDLLGTVRAHSVLAGLGMPLLVLPDQDDAMTAHAATGTRPVGVSRTARGEFSIVAPLDFAATGEDVEAPLSAWPATTTEVRHSGLRQHTARVAIPRSMQRERPIDVLAAELSAAIAAGIGRAVDRVALATLLTGDTPAPLGTWRDAVAAGTAFDRLRAVAGPGATLPEARAIEGTLFVDGIPAAATDQAATSFVGDFSTICCALAAQVGILVKKTGVDGGLEVVTFFAAGAPSATPRTRVWRMANA